MFAAINVKFIVILLANFGRALEHGKTLPMILVLIVVSAVAALFAFGRSVQRWESQQPYLDTDLSEHYAEIDSWESHWEDQEARYIASLTGADYLEATDVYEDDRGTEEERLLAEVAAGIVPSIFHPCGWCRRCALHDDPGGCLTVEEYERDFPKVAAASIAMATKKGA